MRHPHSQSNRNSGFTLIEVLLTVTIMAIVSIAGASSIIDLQRTSRVNQTYSTYKNFLEIARTYAINGKKITSGNPSVTKVPNFFGVGIKTKDTTCTKPAGQLVNPDNLILFAATFDAPDSTYNLNTDAAKTTTLDNLCINPKVAYEIKIKNSVQLNPPGPEMVYAAPFGNFSSPATAGSIERIDITICDKGNSTGTSCPATPTYKKTFTLFSNVGVPEEL